METNLLDRMLGLYQASTAPVTITLQNRIRVTGTIAAFDSYVILIQGQKREIVYRHAVSCLAASMNEDAKKKASPMPEKGRPSSRTPDLKKRQQSPTADPHPSQPSETSINSSMKEGLLKWMQEQKAAK